MMQRQSHRLRTYVRRIGFNPLSDKASPKTNTSLLADDGSASPRQTKPCEGSIAWSPHYNRTLLLRKGFDEKVVYLTHDEIRDNLIDGVVKVSGPLRLCWSILHPCNLDCPYCLDGGKEIATPNLDSQLTLLSRMTSSKQLLTIDFSGGEPLLHKHLYDLLGAVRASGIGVTITTHGGLLERHAERLAGFIDGVRVSIDGSRAEYHDSLRKSPGLFNALIHGVKKLKENDISVRINTVVMKPNIDDVEDIILLSRDLGAREISLLQFIPIGHGASKLSDYFINTEEFLRIGGRLKSCYESPDFEVRLRDIDGAAGYVTVYANGLVLANADLDARSLQERQQVLGSLTESDLDLLWYSRFGALDMIFND